MLTAKGFHPSTLVDPIKCLRCFADKIEHYFVNLGKDKQIRKIKLKEKRTPDEAFLSEKVAFEI